MLTFTSDDWAYVKENLETHLKNKRALLENPDKSYREVLEARSCVNLLKTLLNLPESARLTPANKG